MSLTELSKNRRVLGAAIALAAGLFASSAHAVTTSQTAGLPLSETDLPLDLSYNFTKFDTGLGTLTDASIAFQGSATLNFNGTNRGTSAARAGIGDNLTLSFGSSLSALDVLIFRPLSLSVASGLADYAVGETKSFDELRRSNNRSTSLASILTELSGPGSFSVSCRSDRSFLIAVSPIDADVVATARASQAACGVTLSYTYTPNDTNLPVPEPMSLGLLGAGLLGLSLSRRRR